MFNNYLLADSKRVGAGSLTLVLMVNSGVFHFRHVPHQLTQLLLQFGPTGQDWLRLKKGRFFALLFNTRSSHMLSNH